MGKPFDAVLKAAFLAAVHGYMDKGWSAGSAYKQVAAEYQQEGKEVPEKNTCYNWLAREKRESGGEGADSANCPTCPTSPTGPTKAEAEDPTEAAPELDDYTSRLEMMVRLYRTRSEAAVDAVCDCLLPGLLEEGEKMRKLVIGNVELAEMICDFAGALPGSVYEKKVKHELNVLRPWASQYEPVSMADAARLGVKVIEKAEQTGKDGN